MALFITDICINCGACEPECPNQAIYAPGTEWSMSEGTNLQGLVGLYDGSEIDADDPQPALSDDFYFIVPEKCTECKGFHDEAQCVAFCPVDDCILVHAEHVEEEETLLAKQEFLHG
jgi:ferredoxin